MMKKKMTKMTMVTVTMMATMAIWTRVTMVALLRMTNKITDNHQNTSRLWLYWNYQCAQKMLS